MERSVLSLAVPFLLLSILGLGSASGEEDQVLVESWGVRSDIRYRFATTQIRSVVFNSHSELDQEALFRLVLPDEAFISNFTMERDGVVNVGVVKELEEAKADYEAAKSRGESAGLFKTQARHTNKFDYSVNIRPLQRVIFTLTYQEVLRRKFGRYDHVIHLLNDENVGHMTVDVTIHENREISMLDIPDLQNDLDVSPGEKDLAVVERPSSTSARVHYEYTVESSSHNSTDVPSTFTVRYDVKRDFSAGEVLVVDGYFIHFFAPASLPPIPKDILFVLDVSGSMMGRKIDQLKEAMTKIVQDMHEHDMFNILTFNGAVEFWQTRQLKAATEDGKKAALSFVSDMRAGGMTNIHSALTEAIKFLLEYRNARHVPVIFFLTDGLPSAGIRAADAIAQDVRELNADVASIHGLAFGDNADYELLKKVSSQNSGVARKIYEASDAALQVRGFYDEISTVTLDNLQINYVNDTVDTDTLTRTEFKNFFNGSEVMVAGKLSNLNSLVNILVQGVGAEGEVNLVLDDSMVYTDIVLPDDAEGAITDPSSLSSIAEKSWAFLTIKNLLNEKLKSDDAAEKEKIDERILELSLKYSFVTPLTSIVVTEKTENKSRIPDLYSGDQDSSPPEDARTYQYVQRKASRQMAAGLPMRSHSHSSSLAVKSNVHSLQDPPPPLLSGSGGPSKHFMHWKPMIPPRPRPTMALLLTRPVTLTRTPAPPLPTRGGPVTGGGGGKGNRKKGGRRRGGGQGKSDKGKEGKSRGGGQRGKKKRKKSKMSTTSCRFWKMSHLKELSLDFADGKKCHKAGPKKFVAGELLLYSNGDDVTVSIVTTKGKRMNNGLLALRLKLADSTLQIDLGTPNVTDLDLQPGASFTIKRRNGSLQVKSPKLDLQMTREVNRKGRRHCRKWVTYTIAIKQLPDPVSRRRRGRHPRPLLPSICQSQKPAVSKKEIKAALVKTRPTSSSIPAGNVLSPLKF